MIPKNGIKPESLSDGTYNDNCITSSTHLRSAQRPFRNTPSMAASSPDHT